jgi:hypothetical protein
VPQTQRRIATPEEILLMQIFAKPIWDLRPEVRTSGVVDEPDHVCVTGPANWWLRVTRRRRQPGGRPEDADVVQYGYQLTSCAEMLPTEWFQEGDEVQVERTHPFEPRPPVAQADSRPSWLGGQPGTGMGDFISRGR